MYAFSAQTLSLHVEGETPPVPAGTVNARAMFAAGGLVALREIGLAPELTLRSFPVEVLPDPTAAVEDLVMPAIRAAVKDGVLSTDTGTVELLTIGEGVEGGLSTVTGTVELLIAVAGVGIAALLLPSLIAMTGASSTLLAISSASSANPPISSVMRLCVSYVIHVTIST